MHTPGQKTIEDVARFLGVSPKNKIKTLALMAEEPASDKKKDGKAGKPRLRAIVVLMRGDHQLNEAKLNATVGAATRPMEEGGDQGAVQVSCRIFGAARRSSGLRTSKKIRIFLCLLGR